MLQNFFKVFASDLRCPMTKSKAEHIQSFCFVCPFLFFRYTVLGKISFDFVCCTQVVLIIQDHYVYLRLRLMVSLSK